MDQQKLRSLVFDKTGVKVDIDDPIFALVALNEAVLEETVERHVALIEAASLELAQHARQAGGLAPRTGGPSEFAPAAGPVRPIATQSPIMTPRELRLLGAAAGVAVLSALLVLGGQALLTKPAPQAAAPALTPEQQAAMTMARKLERALPRLDAKTRAAVEAELNKP